jgi:uncharacterized protein YdeI (YjbR/CyaY-like superfamily)
MDIYILTSCSRFCNVYYRLGYLGIREKDMPVRIDETLDVGSRGEWRRWLRANHRRKNEIWLHIYRVGADPRKISLSEAIEEALCFGWIDSVMHPVDRERFVLRFSPRRKGSIWAESNRRRVLEMARRGRMRKAGLATLPPELHDECLRCITERKTRQKKEKRAGTKT